MSVTVHVTTVLPIENISDESLTIDSIPTLSAASGVLSSIWFIMGSTASTTISCSAIIVGAVVSTTVIV